MTEKDGRPSESVSEKSEKRRSERKTIQMRRTRKSERSSSERRRLTRMQKRRRAGCVAVVAVVVVPIRIKSSIRKIVPVPVVGLAPEGVAKWRLKRVAKGRRAVHAIRARGAPSDHRATEMQMVKTL